MTTKKAAALLKMRPKALRRLARALRLRPATQYGQRWDFSPAQVGALLMLTWKEPD